MLRTAAERASILRAWRSDPRHRGLEPPVEIVAPGLKAPKRASREQKAAVQSILRQHVAELTALDQRQAAAFLPVLKRAQNELATRLADWTHQTPDGELRWSAWKYRGALVQLHGMVAHLEHEMGTRLTTAGAEAQRLALEHLITETARFAKVFGDDMPPLQLNLAHLIAMGNASLVPRFRSSAERYAWGRKFGVWRDINERLAVDILSGASVSETVDRLQEHGGPRGVIALQGVKGEAGAVIALIPEGLFARYRWKAETYVRTEMAEAYGRQTKLGLLEAQRFVPDLMWRWCTDGGGCPRICEPMDGQVVGLHESFIAGDGMPVDGDGGAHPNCRCRRGAYRAHWPALLDSMGLN